MKFMIDYFFCAIFQMNTIYKELTILYVILL